MAVFKANGGVVGGVELNNYEYLFISLILKKRLASPPGIEPGTKP